MDGNYICEFSAWHLPVQTTCNRSCAHNIFSLGVDLTWHLLQCVWENN